MSYEFSDKTFLEIVAVLTLQDDLRHLVHQSEPAALGIVVPENLVKAAVAEAATGWLRATFYDEHYDDEDNMRSVRRQSRDFVTWTVANGAKDLKRDTTTPQDAHWLVFVDDPGLIGARFRVALDAVIDVEVTPTIVQDAAQIFDGQTLPEEEAAFVAQMDGREMELFFRRGRSISAVVAKLRALKSVSPRVIDIEAPRLEDLHGYGAAKKWGLELAKDLTDWSVGKIAWRDVDTGILLSGPPGCGKTTFAAALARTCDVTFVAASYAQWQAKGHQGDMLKAMRSTFERAMGNAPCILLIDEIDSFPNRDANHGGHESYVRGVVNGLLELLDGTDGREGVIVVGACNNPTILDPAIVRSGRLDRHIEIRLPDEAGRLGVLSFHLGEEVDGLVEIAQQTEGMSGADLERIVREARRAARRDRRAIRLGDLQASLPTALRLSEDLVRATAIHEVGHAVVGAVLMRGKISAIRIVSEVHAGTRFLGAVRFDHDPTERQTRAQLDDQLAVFLAGMSAEQMLLGAHDEGCASDLAAATRRAALALGCVGMGDSLISVGSAESSEDIETLRRLNPRLDVEIDKLLKTQAARARSILESHRDAVVILSERLIKDKTLNPDEVYASVMAAAEGPVMGAAG